MCCRDPECYPPPIAVERVLAGTLMRATSPAAENFFFIPRTCGPISGRDEGDWPRNGWIMQ